jgi:hypothetical protein
VTTTSTYWLVVKCVDFLYIYQPCLHLREETQHARDTEDGRKAERRLVEVLDRVQRHHQRHDMPVDLPSAPRSARRAPSAGWPDAPEPERLGLVELHVLAAREEHGARVDLARRDRRAMRRPALLWIGRYTGHPAARAGPAREAWQRKGRLPAGPPCALLLNAWRLIAPLITRVPWAVKDAEKEREAMVREDNAVRCRPLLRAAVSELGAVAAFLPLATISSLPV